MSNTIINFGIENKFNVESHIIYIYEFLVDVELMNFLLGFHPLIQQHTIILHSETNTKYMLSAPKILQNVTMVTYINNGKPACSNKFYSDTISIVDWRSGKPAARTVNVVLS